MKKFFAVLLTVASLPVIWAAELPEQMVLVKDNKAKFRVVIPAGKPSRVMQVAIDAITKLTHQSTDAYVTVVPENKLASAPQDMINIHIGLTEFVKKLNLDFPRPAGFMIHFADAKNIICAGYPVVNSDLFHVDAASHFMEHFMGARFLMPGELGTHVPKLTNWIIKPENLRVVPDIWVRSWSGTHGQAFGSRERHQQAAAFNWALSTHCSAAAVFRYNHNVGNLLDPEKYAKTNPEFFPLIDGKRRIPPKLKLRDWRLRNWEPCYTADGIAEETAKNLIEYFDKNPYSLSQSLSVNDSGEICRCDKCKAKNSQMSPGVESQSYYEWVAKTVNIVNKKYPDRLYGLLNYWVTREMPENVKLPQNVIPIVCEDLKFYVDPKLDKILEERLKKWDKLVSSIGWWDYSFEGAYMVPYYNAPYMAKKLRHLYKNHNLRVYTDELHPGRHWKGGPQVYMIQKLCWNIDLDEEALITEWLELMVGKEAAVPFRKYFEVWANFWTNKVPKTPWFQDRAAIPAPFLQRKDASYLDALEYEDITRSIEYLDQTLAAAPEGIHKQRAEFFRNYFVDAASRYLLPYINMRKLSESGKNAPGKTVCEYTFDQTYKPWVPWQLARHTAKLTLDRTVGRSKAGALKLDRDRSLNTGMVFFRRPLDFKLEAGKNYRISVWAKGKNLLKGSTARIMVTFPLKTGGALGTEPLGSGRVNYAQYIGIEKLGDEKWHKLEVYVAVPAKAWDKDVIGVDCQLEATSKEMGGAVWFDDFKVEEITVDNTQRYPEITAEVTAGDDAQIWKDPETGETLGQELVADGDMEQADCGKWFNSYTPEVKAKTTAAAHSGKQSMHLVSDSAGDGIMQIMRPTARKELFMVPFKAMKKGAEYRVQLWIKYTDCKNFKDIRLPGTGLKALLKNPDNNWHKHTFRVTCTKPESTDYFSIAYGDNKPGECFIDDVSIREILKK